MEVLLLLAAAAAIVNAMRQSSSTTATTPGPTTATPPAPTTGSVVPAAVVTNTQVTATPPATVGPVISPSLPALPPVSPGPGGIWSGATACDGTTFSRVVCAGETITFLQNGRAVQIPGQIFLMFPQAAYKGGLTVVVGKGNATGQCVIVTSAGLVQTPVGTIGNMCCLIRSTATGFEVFAYDYQGAPLIHHLVLDPTGAVASQDTITTGVLQTSQGWLGFNADGSLRWTDLNRSITVNGHMITLPVLAGPYQVGQANDGPSGLLATDGTSIFRVYNSNIGGPQLPCNCAADQWGRVDVAVTDDPGGFYPSSSWTAQGPVVVPTIPPFTVPRVVGAYLNNQPNPADLVNTNGEIVFGPWPQGGLFKKDGTPDLPWIDTEYAMSAAGGSLTLAQAVQSQPYTPKVIYWKDTNPDGSLATLSAPEDFIAYPWYRNPGESLTDFQNRCRATARLIKSWGRRWIMVAGAWNRGTLSDDQVLENFTVYRTDADDGACQGIVFFGIGRGANISPPQYKPIYGQCVTQFQSPSVSAWPSHSIVRPVASSATNGVNTPVTPPPATGSAPPVPDYGPSQGLMDVRANFCNLQDAQGRVMFTVSLLTIWVNHDTATWNDWIARLKAAGSTHVFVSPVWSYPGSPFAAADVRNNPTQFRAFLGDLINAGLYPVVFLSGADGGQAEIDTYWPALLSACKDIIDRTIWIPAWEPIPGTTWTPQILSYALGVMRSTLGESAIGAFHTSPDRWTGCGKDDSEGPDPWGHSEPGFWTSNNGEWLKMVFPETGHGSYVTAPITTWNQDIHGACGGGVTAYPTPQDSWINRFSEGLYRSGQGNCSWRPVTIVLAETVAYDYFHGNATDADARRVAADGARVAGVFGVRIGFGNGLPG